MGNPFGECWKARGRNNIQRMLLSVFIENDAVLFKNQMSLMFAKLRLKPVRPNVP